MNITILIYLKNRKKPFIIEFENKQLLNKFLDSLTHDIITVGPLTFARSEFRYCIEK